MAEGPRPDGGRWAEAPTSPRAVGHVRDGAWVPPGAGAGAAGLVPPGVVGPGRGDELGGLGGDGRLLVGGDHEHRDG
jgi:hypothetical protein